MEFFERFTIDGKVVQLKLLLASKKLAMGFIIAAVLCRIIDVTITLAINN